jgi:hypothetical protein
MRRLLLVVALVACKTVPITPDDVARLKPGQHVRVHLWAPGGPGPGTYVTGTYQGQDDAKIFVNDGKTRVEIFKGEIHDDTRDVR